MNLYLDGSLLDATLLKLSSAKDEVARITAAQEIGSHIEAAARELSLERFARFENELYQNIFTFVNGMTPGEQVGGIQAIRELISCPSASAEAKVLKFAQALSTALLETTDYALIELIADAFGHMARTSPVSDVDYLEGELNRALDWLKGRHASYRRFAACAVLKQLARNAPTIFFARIHEFFDSIWTPMWDSSNSIRVAAGEALSACLSVLRDRTYHLQWYCFLYDQFLEGFKLGTEECVHGSLLVVNEALKFTGDFMIPRFKEVCRSIMQLKDHRSRVVRAAIVDLLPSLAQLCPDAFARAHMTEAVEFLRKCSKDTELRPPSLLAAGKLCRAVGPYLVNRIDDLMQILKDSFPNGDILAAAVAKTSSDNHYGSSSVAASAAAVNSGESTVGNSVVTGSTKERVQFKPPVDAASIPQALRFIAGMVVGLGSAFHQKVLVLLEPMLQSGLTIELIDTLATISQHMPQQRPMVQYRLLEEAVLVLGGNTHPPLLEPAYVRCWTRKIDSTSLDQVASSAKLAMRRQFSAVGHGSLRSRRIELRSRNGVESNSSLVSMSGAPAGVVMEKGYTLAANSNAKPVHGMKTMVPVAGTGIGAVEIPVSAKTSTSTSHGILSVFNRFSTAAGNSGKGSITSPAADIKGNVKSPSRRFFTGLVTNMKSAKPNHRGQLTPAKRNDLVLLALHTLASLSIPTMSLIPLVQHSVMPYLMSDDHHVRRQAVVTCARIISPALIMHGSRGPSGEAIEEVLWSLLEAAVSDTSAIVRLAVIKSLTPEFFRCISQPKYADVLAMLLSDEDFEVKMEALSLLGCISRCNPACLMPSIRQQLLHIVAQMRGSPEYRCNEEASLLLRNFLQFNQFHAIVRPFMLTIVGALPLQSDVKATTAALEALGELATVLSFHLLPFVDDLMPVVILQMLDSSSIGKQCAAVKTLGQLVSSTGVVVRPYFQYPQLLPKALDLLFRNDAGSTSYALRIQILRTLGLLGALEPNKYSLIVGYLNHLDKVKRGELRDEFCTPSGFVASAPVMAKINLIGGDAGVKIGASAAIDENDKTIRKFSDQSQDQQQDVAAKASLQSVCKDVSNQQGGLNDPSSLADYRTGQPQLSVLSISTGQQGNATSLTGGELLKSDLLLDGDSAEAPAYMTMYEQSAMKSIPEPPPREAAEGRPVPGMEDYYPRIAVSSLIKVLKDRSLTVHHSTATHTIVSIFRSLGVKCVPYLEQVVPYFLQILHRSNPGLRESVLQQLAQLVSISGQHIAPYMPSIIEILRKYWTEHLEYVLFIVQQVALSTSETFRSYLPMLLPLLLSSLSLPRGITSIAFKANSSLLQPLEQTLLCHKFLRYALKDHIELYVPALCKLLSGLQNLSSHTSSVQALTIKVLRHLCRAAGHVVREKCHIVLSMIVQTVTRAIVLCYFDSEVLIESVQLLTTLAQTMGQRILPYDNLILRSLEGKAVDTEAYLEVTASIRNGSWNEIQNYREWEFGVGSAPSSSDILEVASESDLISMKTGREDVNHPSGAYAPVDRTNLGESMSGAFSLNCGEACTTGHSNTALSGTSDASEVPKLLLNQQQLARAWDVSQRSTATDWLEWLWRFNIELLRESPIPTLRACAALAQSHAPMARELFHAAFVSCWNELNEHYQELLVRALQSAFRSPTIPPEILQSLLNLAEFMERDVEKLPISLSILAELAHKAHAYAKALYYREMEFHENPAECFESLININKKLDQYDAASGLLKVVKQKHLSPHDNDHHYKVQESWLAKLGHWEEALLKYDEVLANNARDSRAIAGKLKCLDALGRWEEAIQLCEENLDVMRVENELSGNGGSSNLRATSSYYAATRTSTGLSLTGAQLRIQAVTEDTPSSISHSSSGGPVLTKPTAAGPYKVKAHTKAAVIGARAAWSLNNWEKMDKFVAQVPPGNIDGSFLRAVLAVHKEKYTESSYYIEQTRTLLDKMISTLLTESYSRAYVPFIMVQQCAELEEIIQYKILLKEASSRYSAAVDKKIGNNSSHNFSDTGSMGDTTVGTDNSMNGGVTAHKVIDDAEGDITSMYVDAMHSLRRAGARYTLDGRWVAEAATIKSTFKQSGVPSRPFTAGQRDRTKKSPPMHASFNTNGTVGAQNYATNQYKQAAATAIEEYHSRVQEESRKAFLREKWRQRIRGCYSSGRAAIPFWKYLLNGRRMVLNEKDDLDTWLEFVTLCRNGGNSELAERVLSLALSNSRNKSHKDDSAVNGNFGCTEMPLQDGRINSPPSQATSASISISTDVSDADIDLNNVDKRILFAILMQKWAVGQKETALVGLERLVRKAADGSVTLDASRGGVNSLTVDASYLSCLLTLGKWKLAIADPSLPVNTSTRKEVLSLYARATTVDPKSYEAWHQWGLSNFRAIEEARNAHFSSHVHNHSHHYQANSVPLSSGLPSLQQVTSDNIAVVGFAINSIKGLMRALTLGSRRNSSSVMQDMLCILSLWFRYGKNPEIGAHLEAGLSTVHLDTWLGVLPQLIARIDHPEFNTRNILHHLLERIGKEHAQALVFPLFVAIKSPTGRRKEAAEKLMSSLRQHSAMLIDQALQVSQELVGTAILREEHWHLALEEASRIFFHEGNTQGMLDLLRPLHDELRREPNTLREASFKQTYGHDLADAWQCVQKYVTAVHDSGGVIPRAGAYQRNPNNQRPEENYLYQAWDFYFAVFKRINAQLMQMSVLDLQNCSPTLFRCRDLDLGVPGTYSVSGAAVRILKFGQFVQVIRSKQRPRKLRIFGEDGKQFLFLLKGHEDLRQDERAMQLFGLVNALLYHDSRLTTDDYGIQRYAAIPLSPSAGLIGWVPNCDTLNDLICSHRENKKVMRDVEHKFILQFAPNKMYDMLPAIQKLEVFEYALSQTAGDDLAKILWLKSENSESWLQRRSTYTRSLAVMSMVGYILGLGDRHPSNLMLDRQTGKVLHIDFGDCFEIAKHREKFPELVPFRLTRMLVNAMEVAGIEGNYRSTCEKVMSLLRENRDSLVATLDAFVHDPLISWRLLHIKKDIRKEATKQQAETDTTVFAESNHVKHSTEILEAKREVMHPARGVDKQSIGPSSETDTTVPVPILVRPRPRNGSSSSFTPNKDGSFAHERNPDYQQTEVVPSDEQSHRKMCETEVPPPPPLNIAATNSFMSSLQPGSSLSPIPEKRKDGRRGSAKGKLVNADGSGAVEQVEAESTVGLAHDSTKIQTRYIGSEEEEDDEDDEYDDEEHDKQRLPLQKDVKTQKRLPLQLSNRKPNIDENGFTTIVSGVPRSDHPQAQLEKKADVETPKLDSIAQQTESTQKLIADAGCEGVNGSYRPNLHLQISSMANSASLLNPSGASSFVHSLAHSHNHSLLPRLNSLRSGTSHLESQAAEAMMLLDTVESTSTTIHGHRDGDLVNDLQQELTDKAVTVIRRVMDKLTGLDFTDGACCAHAGKANDSASNGQQDTTIFGDAAIKAKYHVHAAMTLEVPEQVDRLIKEATSNENLSQSFFGWCPFW